MTFRVNSINFNTEEILDRSFLSPSEVQSIKINPRDGSYLICYPLLNDGSLIRYSNTESSTTIKNISGYNEINFPLDSEWNIFSNKIWIADAGNNNMVLLDSSDYSFIRSINGFFLPHSIILNKNNKNIYVKSYSNSYTQKISEINNKGETVFEFEFPCIYKNLNIEYTTQYLEKIPKYFTMDYDFNRNRLWFVSGSILYMVDFNNKNIVENDLKDVRLDSISCVNIDKNSGNAFVIIDDGVNYYIQQIFKDNNLLLGTAYLEEQ